MTYGATYNITILVTCITEKYDTGYPVYMWRNSFIALLFAKHHRTSVTPLYSGISQRLLWIEPLFPKQFRFLMTAVPLLLG